MDLELTYRESSIIVQWRALTPRERESVDGIRVVFGKANGMPLTVWKKSELLHRDITSYEIEKVQPNTKYVVNLEFIAKDNAHVISEKSSEILTPSDVFAFKVRITCIEITGCRFKTFAKFFSCSSNSFDNPSYIRSLFRSL